MGLIESMMGLRLLQGNLRLVFRLFSLMRGSILLFLAALDSTMHQVSKGREKLRANFPYFLIKTYILTPY